MDRDERNFRDLVTLSGSPARGDVFRAETDLAEGTFLSLLAADGLTTLYVSVERDGDRVHVACQRADQDWETLGWLPIATGGLCQLRLHFSERAIEVSVGPSSYLHVEVDPHAVFRIAGAGHWEVMALELVGIAEAKSKVLTDIALLPDVGSGVRSDLIFDIGMHNGDDTEFYLLKGFCVIGVDANPALCSAAARRFSQQIERGQLHILNLGIGPQAGVQTFYVNRTHSEWSSFNPAIASRGHDTEEVVVNIQDVSGITARIGIPHYAKIDIEGYDMHAVAQLTSCAEKPSFISYENGTLDVFEVLVSAGYTRFKLINQAEVPSQTPPLPAREGLAARHRFNPGSSGLFGDESPGDWLPVDQTRALLQSHHSTRAVDLTQPAYIAWFDLHAALDSAEVALRRSAHGPVSTKEG